MRTKLAPPWITYINELQALFDNDPQIAFNIADNGRSVTIACNNGDKCAALAQLLPAELVYGNVTVSIAIDGPMSNRAFLSNKELFETAFWKNPVLAYCVAPKQEGYDWIDCTYVVFKNCVVQFFNDNLDDCHGVVSTLYQDIAKDVFVGNDLVGVFFNTDINNKVGAPLGEWP